MGAYEEADKAFAALYEIFSQPLPVQRYCSYDLTFLDGEPVFTLSEFDRIFDEAMQGMSSMEPSQSDNR